MPANAVNKYRFHVVALGINQNAEVTLNNDFITNHSGGYTTILQTVPANTVRSGEDNVLRLPQGLPPLSHAVDAPELRWYSS
jgi:hypothetical protein